jgi:hypothetical protein
MGTLRSVVKRWIGLMVMLALPVAVHAQEAAISGTVTDATGGVLPGVTITAVHEASGNTFLAVTDGTGTYRIPARIGVYRLTAELPGFTTVTRSGVQLLVGQTVPVNLQMSVSTLQETVTVTGEAPLLDVTSSTVGTNMDPRQVQELPINGRNWMDLSLLAPGARRNEAGGYVQDRQGYSIVNVDGQQVTTNYHSAGDNEQPQYSRDAIAEFEVIANRFDATQGRSTGMVVNAVTKSGTNTLSGSLGGYFRHDRFNAKDFFRDEVLPFQNQQVSTTLGGPIVQDRIHYFANYEFEREPQTYVYTSPYPSFNIDQQLTDKIHKYVGRMDFQFTPSRRLSVRTSGMHNTAWAAGGSTSHPSGANHRTFENYQTFGTFTQVLGNTSVNELKVGQLLYDRNEQDIGRWRGGAFPHRPVGEGGSVLIALRGYNIGASVLGITMPLWQVRDDYTTSFSAKGRHDVKLGAEYMRFTNQIRWCLRCDGEIDARGGPPPANLEELFPVWDDASTWNLEPLAPITRWVFHSLSPVDNPLGPFRQEHHRNIFAAWFQDDWQVGSRLTLNLGARWDFDDNSHSEKLEFRPWLPGNLPHEYDNLAPRLGFNYLIDDNTTLRGGYGLFFAFSPNDGVHQSLGYSKVRFEDQLFNDGRADFTRYEGSDGFVGWFNGPIPSYEEELSHACDVSNRTTDCAFRSLVQEINYPGRENSYSHQASIGVQRQLGSDMAVEVNYLYTGGRGEEIAQNVNLTYNPATGANNPFGVVDTRAFPTWGVVNFEMLEGWSDYHGTDVTFTKRFSDNWQMNANYTLAFFRDANPFRDQWFIGDDGIVARRPIGFALSPDLGGEYTLAATDQRHRANINGIWEIGYGFQFSGLYFFGSGERRSTDTGADRRNVGSLGEERLRADGSIIERNNFVGDQIHRVDLRLQKRFGLGGRTTIDGIFEVFNVFNRENYGSYVTDESNARFGQPSFNSALAYQPRMMQLGVRFAF